MDKIITFSFCDSFIKKLTEYINDTYIKKGVDISRLAIVFGGNRPQLFLKKELAKILKVNYYSPAFFTINEFISYIVRKNESFSMPSELENSYLLYELARKKTPKILKGRETFAQFLPWTNEIYSFIEQLDLEDVQEKELLSVKSVAEIGYPVPKDINMLLESIVVLRKAYHDVLIREKLYSRGLQYLMAAKNIEKTNFEEFDQILFCNFFYFYTSQENIVKNLFERNKATLIFQGDQRKWPVLSKISRDFSCTIKEGESPKALDFNLKLYSGFDNHSQVCMVREILKSVKNLEKTVIVLPSTENIIPLLSEISTLVSDYNISLGYPLKRCSLYALFELIFKAQLSKKKDRYYSKDYLKVLKHPFIKNLNLAQSPEVTTIIIETINKILTGKEKSDISGSIFIKLKDIENLNDLYLLTQETLKKADINIKTKTLKDIIFEIHKFAFEGWGEIKNFNDFSNVLADILDLLISNSFIDKYPLNLNIARELYEIKEEFSRATFRDEQFPKDEIFKIFDTKIENKMVSFKGSPLKGMQILGLLETRSLNFENVIVLDVNEGVLPKLKIYEPLIPREVKISLKLDSLELEEEIQRYSFMRLISSARNVYLVYQENKEKEKSRLVEELIWEREKRENKLDVVPVTKASFDVKVSNNIKEIKKTAKMIDVIKNMIFSASSINTYVRNPIEFYYNYVLGLREHEDLLDEPEARQVGTFMHEFLEEAFKPYINKSPEINSKFRNNFFKTFEKKYDETISKSMKSDSFLLKTIIIERLNRFLDNEQNNDIRKLDRILFVEKRFENEIPLSIGKVKFKYVVDRIDKLKDGTIMLIDYKTGSIDQMPKRIDLLKNIKLSRDTIKEHIRSFQVPLYFYYLSESFKGQKVNASLYNLRTLKMQTFIDYNSNNNYGEINEVFLNALEFILKEIFNPEIAFVSDE